MSWGVSRSIIASPAAALAAAGVDVVAIDLAVEDWDSSRLNGADAVAFSVPMHTAMRLAIPMARELRRQRPGLPIAFYGLYAGVGQERVVGDVADSVFVGEYEPALVEWAVTVESGRDGKRNDPEHGDSRGSTGPSDPCCPRTKTTPVSNGWAKPVSPRQSRLHTVAGTGVAIARFPLSTTEGCGWSEQIPCWRTSTSSFPTASST